MRPLSRRALFALPVALPVAAVAAKVAPLASAPKPYAVSTVFAEELHIMKAGEWRETGAVSANVARKLADIEPFDAAFNAEIDELRLALTDWRLKKSCGGVEGHAALSRQTAVTCGARASGSTVKLLPGDRPPAINTVNARQSVVEAGPQDTLTEEQLAATLGIDPPQPVAIGIDAGGNDDMVAVAVVRSEPVVA